MKSNIQSRSKKLESEVAILQRVARHYRERFYTLMMSVLWSTLSPLACSDKRQS